MPSENDHKVALALKEFVGEKVGVGPDINQLIKLGERMEMDLEDMRQSLESLEQFGFIRIDPSMSDPVNIPKPLRGMVGVTVLEPLHQYIETS